jgi:sialate O-acetylesterase
MLKELAVIDIAKYAEHKKAVITSILKDFPLKDSGLVDSVAVFAAPGLNDDNWATISGADLWENNGFRGIDGIAWYRKTITLTQDDIKSVVRISLGAIDDRDITWVNGVKIGATNKYDVKRFYPIPPNVLKAGKNVIAIRVQDTEYGGGLYGGRDDKFLEIGNRKLNIADNWKFKVTEVNLGSPDMGPNDYPTLLYNAMIHPLVGFGIKGVIWYQGESNASRARQYQRVFPSLIQDWRHRWQQGDFSFLFVSLANYKAPDDLPSPSEWAELREAQTMALALPNTGMALAIDIGDQNDIHPKNKQEVGKRLALAALGKTYHKPLIYSGPMYHSVLFTKGKAIITFTQTGGGLKAKNKYGYINGFAIAGADRKFKWATAFITGNNTIEVAAKLISNPVAVRFAWANNPDDFNLYNAEGLPANPFRTDKWPGITH